MMKRKASQRIPRGKARLVNGMWEVEIEETNALRRNSHSTGTRSKTKRVTLPYDALSPGKTPGERSQAIQDAMHYDPIRDLRGKPL